MNKLCIFSDLHHKTKVIDEILPQIAAEIGYDRVLFGGDYQDDFGDNASIARETAIWTKNKLEDPNNILLKGNHDIGYEYPDNPYLSCSGFERPKSFAVNDILKRADWDKLQLFHSEQGILFTHAGVSKTFLDMMVKRGECDEFDYTLENVIKHLERWKYKGDGLARTNFGYFIYGAGRDRGGSQSVGSPIWIDHSQFHPTPLFHQIYFHSTHYNPDFRFMDNFGPVSVNVDSNALLHNIETRFSKGFGLDLDTGLKHFAILEDGVLQIYKIVLEKGKNRIGKNRIGKKLFERNIHLK